MDVMQEMNASIPLDLLCAAVLLVIYAPMMIRVCSGLSESCLRHYAILRLTCNVNPKFGPKCMLI